MQQEKYRQYRKNQSAASGTIDLELNTLRSMYRMAVKSKLIPSDFLPGEFVLKNKRIPRRTISDAEFGLLLNHANDNFQDVLICAYESAMRSSEICKLTVGQVKLDMKHISGDVLDYIDLGIFDTKTGARRTVPVSVWLKDILKKRIQGKDNEDPVFTTGTGRKFTPIIIFKHFRATCKKAGILCGDKHVNAKGERIGIVFHCFRHTCTSRWVDMGFSDEIIRRATGHKSLEAYQQYIKLDPHAVMRLVKKQRDKNEIKFKTTSE